MSEAQRVALGQTIAGKNQYKVLASVMANFGHALDANQTAIESAGSAAKENAKFMESWEAATNKLAAAWENLSTSVIGGNVTKIVSVLADVVQALSESKVAVAAIQTILTSGALWGGTQLLKAMKIIPAITGEFKNLGFIIQAVSGGAATLGEGLVAAFTSLSASLPIILGVVAAVTALKLIWDAIADAKYEASYENQNQILQEMRDNYQSMLDEIDALKAKGSNLTDYEKRRLEYLEAQTAEMEAQNALANQEGNVWEAWNEEFEENVKAQEQFVRTTGHNAGLVETKNVVSFQNEFAKLIDTYKEGTASTDEMAKSVTEYVNKYKDLVEQTKAYRDAGNELTPLQENLLMLYQVAVNEQAELAKKIGTSTDALNEQYPVYETLSDSIDDATAALERFNEASSVDYSAPLEGYRDAFEKFQEAFQADKVGSGAYKAGIELFGLEGVEDVGNWFENSFTAKVLGAEDSLQSFYSIIQENAEGLKGIIDLKDDALVVSSYADVADYFDTTVEEVEVLFNKLQEYNSQLILTTEDVQNFLNAFDEVEGASDSLENAVAAITEITGQSDPEVISQYLGKLKEAGMIDFDGTKTEIKEVQSELQKTEDKPIGITFEALADSVIDFMNGVTDFSGKTFNLTFKPVFSALESLLDFTHEATGDSSFKGGLAMVNDGKPVNGSSKELIVQDGQAFMMQGEPALVNLKKGATIYNASDTQKILGGVPAFEGGLDDDGHAYDDIERRLQQRSSVSGSGITIPEFDGSGSGANSGKTSGGSSSAKSKTSKNAKEIFDAWLKEKKHALEMDEITEQEYYDALEEMNEKYFANNEKYRDEYWKYQEEIYKFRKKNLESENDLLKDQLDLEEALNDLAKAKAGRKYVFSGGQFGYAQDLDAIASAQQRLRELGGASLVSGGVPSLSVVTGGIGSGAGVGYNGTNIGSVGMGDSSTHVFNIGEIKLDNVTDAQGFVDGLKNLALQYAGARA